MGLPMGLLDATPQGRNLVSLQSMKSVSITGVPTPRMLNGRCCIDHCEHFNGDSGGFERQDRTAGSGHRQQCDVDDVLEPACSDTMSTD